VKHFTRIPLIVSGLMLTHLPAALAAPAHTAPGWRDDVVTRLLQWAQQAVDVAAQAPSPVVYALLLCGLGLMEARTRTRR
jgi:hypothetical protein